MKKIKILASLCMFCLLFLKAQPSSLTSPTGVMLKKTNSEAIGISSKMINYCGTSGKSKLCIKLIHDDFGNDLLLPECTNAMIENIKTCSVKNIQGLRKIVNTKKNITHYLDISNNYVIVCSSLKNNMNFLILDLKSGGNRVKDIEAMFRKAVESSSHKRCFERCFDEYENCFIDRSLNNPNSDLKPCDDDLANCKLTCELVDGVVIEHVKSILEFRKSIKANDFNIKIF